MRQQKMYIATPISSKHYNNVVMLNYLATGYIYKHWQKMAKCLGVQVSQCCNGTYRFSLNGYEVIARKMRDPQRQYKGRIYVVIAFYIPRRGYLYPVKDVPVDTSGYFSHLLYVNMEHWKKSNPDKKLVEFFNLVAKNYVYLTSEV